MKKLLFTVTLMSFSSVLMAAEYTIGQKGKAFTQASIDVKVGDVVNFENNDPFFHNIYSLSDLQSFDLGSYKKGESKPVTFEKAGSVEVECAIHPNMMMAVNVSE